MHEGEMSQSPLRFKHQGVPIGWLRRDAKLAHGLERSALEVNTDSAVASPPISFSRHALLRVPRLDHFISASHGNFLDLAIDVASTDYHKYRTCEGKIDVRLGDRLLDRRVFKLHYVRNQFFIPLHLLFEDENPITIKAKMVGGGDGAEDPEIRHKLDFFLTSKPRVMEDLERASIWVFSSPRSGSTWLAQDILGWPPGSGRGRPMDETGLGRVVSPLELQPQRFFRMDQRQVAYQSGHLFETRQQPQKNQGFPPFRRQLTARTSSMEQLLSEENSQLFLRHVRELALEHFLNVWGFFGFSRAVFKNPVDAQGAETIMQALPNAHMIFLLRDGRDVIRSQFSPFVSPGLATTKDPGVRRYAIAFHAHFWNFQNDIVQSAYDAHAEDRRHFVRYEDLRSEPTRYIGELLDRLGAGLPEDQLAQLVHDVTLENLPADQRGPDKPRQSGRIGGYQDAFSEPEIKLMEAIMGDNLRKYGYLDDPG